MANTPTDNVAIPQSNNIFENVTNNLLKLFQGGAEVYKNVTNKTGVNANTNATNTTNAPGVVSPNKNVFMGLNQNQLILVAGGLTLLLVILVKRK